MAKQTFTAAQVLTAAQMTALQVNDYNQTVSAKTATYVLVAADVGTRITMNAAGATTITVNTSLFAAGDTLEILNIGAGVSTITAGTATVTTSGTLALAQWAGGILYFTSASAAVFIPGGVTASASSFVGAQATANGTSFSYTNGVNTIVPFATENFDTNTFHDTSTNTSRLTIPSGKDGKYLFTATGLFMGLVPTYCYIKLVKNGAAIADSIAYGGQIGSALANANAAVSGAVVVSAVATDYFELFIQSDQSTGSKTLYGSFTCTYLGA